MIALSSLESCKSILDLTINMIPGGILYIIVEDDTIVWKKISDSFELNIFQLGYKIEKNSVSYKAIAEQKTLYENVPRSQYGERLSVVSTPIIDDDGNSYGALTIAIPLLHPVASSFKSFAPIVANMFHEGAFVYMTDLEKLAYRQPSDKFDIPEFIVGYPITEKDVAYKVIQTKKPSLQEVNAEKFGVPIFVANFPLFEDENSDELVATFGIILPKQTAATLREMSNNLENGLSGISAAIEELAASATEIHANEQMLNDNILDIIQISEEINNVSLFIKDIADETKMLGLNAAIEAARAGEAGRGFGVVADEIRKLSDQSKSTVPKINKLTEDIKKKVDEASSKSKNSLEASQEQAAASEEITSSVEEITSMSSELARISLDI